MLDRKTLYVTWTMDCETIADECLTGGPADWELSERSMRGYVEALARRGHRVTLFLIPRVAELQAEVVTDLAARGAELGMHMHPDTMGFSDGVQLGRLPRGRQRELVGLGRAVIGAMVGDTPTSFRSGCFSADDNTIPVLAELGFTQGSVSLPGRHLPEIGAVWRGAVPFAHWADHQDRRLPGQLPFLELPTAADLDDVDRPADEVGDARHLRLEREGILEWGPGLIRRHVARQIQIDWWLKSIVVMTHNTWDYADRDEPARQALEGIADAIEAASTELGLKLQPATLAEMQALANKYRNQRPEWRVPWPP